MDVVCARCRPPSLHHSLDVTRPRPNDSGFKFSLLRRQTVAHTSRGNPARGHDDYNHFALLKEPPTNNIEEGIAAQRESPNEMQSLEINDTRLSAVMNIYNALVTSWSEGLLTVPPSRLG